MSLIRWQPINEIDSWQKEMNSLFNSLVSTSTERANSDFVPVAEMSETAEAVELKLEIPGVNPRDIDIQVTAESIAISGERQSKTKTEADGMTKSEFRYGSFSRVISLPARVKNTEVNAECKDGILHLILPKAEEEKNKVVKVNLG